jgi:hypothetical protein
MSGVLSPAGGLTDFATSEEVTMPEDNSDCRGDVPLLFLKFYLDIRLTIEENQEKSPG